jgi:prepilin-type N-terminal cleavage/methylation domain-containing protein
MTLRYRHRLPQAGFTLVEIAVVIVIIAVLMSMALVVTRGVAAAQKRSITASRMALVDAALVQFVTLNRRLPCPADGRIPSGMANAGVEAPNPATGTCTGNQRYGVVPWNTLGITESDATDGWDRRLTYRADNDLVKITAPLDMSSCDPAGTGPAVGDLCAGGCSNSALGSCTSPSSFLSAGSAPGKGLAIQDVGGTVLVTAPGSGAAYVVISHGESGGGAYLNSGSRSDSTTTDGTQEQLNYADLALRTYYVDSSISDVAGATHFDDIVSRPSVLSLAFKAGLGPRSH